MDNLLVDRIRRATSVRFVCSGNVVRSAFAELMARHLGLDVEVDSVATTYTHESVFPETRHALLSRGVPGEAVDDFRPRRLDRITGDACDPGRLVLAMTGDHRVQYENSRGGGESCHLMMELLGSQEDLADPVLDGVAFDATFRVLERSVRALIAVRTP